MQDLLAKEGSVQACIAHAGTRKEVVPYMAAGVTVRTGIEGDDATRWLAMQASELAVDERTPVTYVTRRGHLGNVTRAFIEVIDHHWVDAEAKQAPASECVSRVLAVLDGAPLDVGEMQDFVLSDLRTLVRRRRRVGAGHQVLILDLPVAVGTDRPDGLGCYALAGLNALSREGVHIITVQQG